MSGENNKDKKDVFELLKDEYFIRMKQWDDPTLTKEEREELFKKEKSIANELKERKGELQERFKKIRKMTVEERQQTIDNAEMILSRVKGLTPEMIETSHKIVELMKRELEKVKVTKGICPHCGKPISLHARFCSRCGNKIEID